MRLIAVLCAVVLLGVAPKAPAPAKSPIVVTVNGTIIRMNPPARMVKGRLLVPVRRTIQGLGLDFNQDGRTITTHIGSKTVTLVAGEDGSVEIKGTLYVPLRFFADMLDSQATFDPKTGVVSIVAELVGRSGDGISLVGKRYEQVGTVTAVDVDSDPPTITLTYNASVRTVQIGANANIALSDVNANVTVPGELTDVRPGDYAHLYGSTLAVADRVVDEYGSRVGTVAAVSGGQMVLSDGHVIVASRTTRISINGTAATINDLQTGDTVAVRYNVASNEVREVLAGRAVPDNGAASAITTIDTSATRPLRARETLNVTLSGTTGGAATFDVGPYVSGLALSERTPGKYTGSYTIPNGANFANVPVIGHLRVGTTDYTKQAAEMISASSSPPGFDDIGPSDGATVNSSFPAIYATFVSDAVAVNPSSVRMIVNGHDVTASTVRSDRVIQYIPTVAYPNGKIVVIVRVADLAGNATSKTWSFVVHAR